jgi:hypothetical protein
MRKTVARKWKAAIRECPLPEGIGRSEVLRWLFRAALAERQGIPDRDFIREMDTDEKGRLVHEWIKSKLADYLK